MSFSIVGIGEVLWDMLPTGPQLGGAPANFAYHAQALGARAQVVTRIGSDGLGTEVLRRLRGMSLPTDTVQVDDQRPTGTVEVSLNDEGVPRFTIHEDVAWDGLIVTAAALEAVRKADAVCFGTLAQRNPVARATIQELLAATPKAALRVFDINLRQEFYSREVIEQSLHAANVLKLNEDELSILVRSFALPGNVRQQLEALVAQFALRLVVLTRGADGSLIYREGSWSEQTSQRIRVIDTVGAGDSFTAALVLGVLNNLNLQAVHAFATDLASYVCSHAGATPALPAELRNRFVAAGGFGASRAHFEADRHSLQNNLGLTLDLNG
jgi:fructokinase